MEIDRRATILKYREDVAHVFCFLQCYIHALLVHKTLVAVHHTLGKGGMGKDLLKTSKAIHV